MRGNEASALGGLQSVCPIGNSTLTLPGYISLLTHTSEVRLFPSISLSVLSIFFSITSLLLLV